MLALCHETIYQHKTEVDEAKGAFKLDCSGFVTLVLKSVAPKALALVSAKNRKSHPLAVDFYETISTASNFPEKLATSQIGWFQVPLAKAAAGDILVWRKEIIVKGETTGHVMVLAKVPEKETDGTYKVRVTDSTSTPHSDDTRKEGQTGLGSGTIWIKLDAEGHCEGYYQTRRKENFHKTALLIGHIEEE